VIILLVILGFLTLRYNFYSYWVQISTTYPLVAQLLEIAVIWLIAVYAVRISLTIYDKVIHWVAEVPTRLNRLFKRLIRYVIYIIAFVFTLGVFGLVTAVQGILVGAGFAGIVLGLAAQQTFANIFAGVSIIFDKAFKIGDWIHLKNSDIVGQVKEINLRSTVIIAPDNTLISLPNSMVAGDAIINYSTHRLRRLFHKIAIAYESDISQAIKIIREVLKNDQATATTRISGQGYYAPIEIVITKLGDFAVNMEARVFVDTTKAGGIFETESRMLNNIKNALTEASIDVPYPTHSIRLKKELQ
jgi:small-conductance mechanosensitive channel